MVLAEAFNGCGIMFSEDWDLDLLNQKAAWVIEELRDQEIVNYFSIRNP